MQDSDLQEMTPEEESSLSRPLPRENAYGNSFQIQIESDELLFLLVFLHVTMMIIS